MNLLDTNVISELRKTKPHGAVSAWFKVNPLFMSAVSAVTIYELQAGAEITRRQDPLKAQEIDRWIGAVEQSVVVFSLGGMEARMAAFLMRGQSQKLLMDAMIAATAATHGLTLATRNTKDFERFGVALVDPFLFPRG